MIQSVLFFVLGFLSALFIALLLLPAVWRRAVRLTTNGIERTMPISLEEIRAGQDQLRAKQAVELRRIELERDQALQKSAALAVESGKGRRDIERLIAENGDFKERARLAEIRADGLRTDVLSRDQLLSQFAGKTKEAEDVLAARIDELGRLGNLYEEASLASTARQVEVMARDSEVERLSRELEKLRRDRKGSKAEPGATDGQAAEALQAEQARAADLAKKLDQTAAELRDKTEKLTRRDRDIAEMQSRIMSKGDDDLRIVDLQRENLNLTAELEALREGAPGNDDNALRETMHNLAADVVTMVARMDGQAEPIQKALDLAPGPGSAKGAVISLADRIRKRRLRGG